MRIDVCSQAAALRLASDAAEKTALLSITSKGEPDVGFADNTNIVSILHLKFNDLSEECDEEGIPYGRPLPVQEDFAGLKAFADGLSCEHVIVHCWEGRSRSAAVAIALQEYLGREGSLSFLEGEVTPNPLVLELARRALGK